MIEIGKPLEYQAAVARFYEQVRCQLKMDSGFSTYFLRNMWVKQGCPLSPAHFGLGIDKLEEIVNKDAKEEKNGWSKTHA